ncbi:MAG TPA: sulfurtransferase TusA family protein [Elusimicrobiales bacterium]|nr:sulfurtransferase TusA family protein [Elusimicrobiales bacterium]
MPAEKIDLSGVPCPANAARALMRLEGLDGGAELEIIIDDGEPAANLPPALEQEGHTIVGRVRAGAKWIITARKSQ